MDTSASAIDIAFLGGFAVDRDSPVPAYYQVEDLLATRIDSGQLPPGTRLPSERVLTANLGISRMTLRQALDRLEREGRLVRRQGTGTFVAEPRVSSPLAGRLRGVGEEIGDTGRSSRVRLLSVGRLRAVDSVTDVFGLPHGAPVIQVRRLRILGDEPLGLSTSWLHPVRCAPVLDSDLAGGSLNEVLVEACGLRLAWGTERISATVLGAEDARHLRTEPGAAAMRIQRSTWDDSGDVIEVVDTLLRGDRFAFEARLSGIDSGGPGPADLLLDNA